MTPKVEAIQAKIDKWDYIKNISTTGNNGVKKESIEWKEILANAISDKGLVFKIHKEHLNSTYK